MGDPNLYQQIGAGYASVRRPDPRIAAQLAAAVRAGPVVNVGAGTGSYEGPEVVLAVEPSAAMIAQRPPGAAPAVRGRAEELPVADGAAAVATAWLTHHHWTDPVRGFAELRRVAPRQVVLTWDPAVTGGFWLLRDYLPEIAEREADLPTLDVAVRELDGEPAVVPVPHDCTDGFLAAYWRRPWCYLDAAVRAGISGFALLAPPVVARGMARLAADLDDGTWAGRHADLTARDELDCGYRLVTGG